MQHRRRGYDDVHQVCSDDGVLNISALVYADDGCISIVAIPTTMSVVAIAINCLIANTYI